MNSHLPKLHNPLKCSNIFHQLRFLGSCKPLLRSQTSCWNSSHPFRQRPWIAFAVAYHIQMIQPQNFLCRTHGSCHLRRLSQFDFKSKAAALLQDEQVQLRTGMHPPEKCLSAFCPGAADDLAHNKALPRSTAFWMRQQSIPLTDTQQTMQQSRIRHINLRSEEHT